MMNVYLQYPWKFPDSPYYKYLLDHPPSNVKFVSDSRVGIIESSKRFRFSNNLKNSIRAVTNALRLPIPNAHITNSDKKFDLIHCAHSLSLNKFPWVADIEAPWSMWISGSNTRLGKAAVRKLLLSEHCKKIMPWTSWANDGIKNIFNHRDIADKLEVVYPAVPLIQYKKTKHPLTITFISRYFWIKGGLVALEALKQLNEKYDIETFFISDAPVDIRKKYPEITFLDVVPQKDLHNYYLPRSDIFLYPSFVDTFGFSMLEAMSFGMPIVTVDNPTRREIVEDGYNGFVLDVPSGIDFYNIGSRERELINGIVNRTSMIIENTSLRKQMGNNGYSLIRNGKFSIDKRNSVLKRIYEEAAKR